MFSKARRLQEANATGMIVISWSAFLGVQYPTSTTPPSDVTLPSLVVNRYDGESLLSLLKDDEIIVRMTPAGILLFFINLFYFNFYSFFFILSSLFLLPLLIFYCL